MGFASNQSASFLAEEGWKAIPRLIREQVAYGMPLARASPYKDSPRSLASDAKRPGGRRNSALAWSLSLLMAIAYHKPLSLSLDSSRIRCL